MDNPTQPVSAASPASGGSDEAIASWQARRRLVLLVIVVCVLVGGLVTLLFDYANAYVGESLARDIIKRQAQFDRERILNPLQTDLTLIRRMADSPLLLSWALDEKNQELKRAALAELESYRRHLRDGSYFFIPRESGNYYYNDISNRYPGGGVAQVMDRDKAEHAWYFAALESPDQIQLNVDPNPTLGRTNIWINIQVRHEGKVVAMAGSGIDLGEFTRTVAVSSTPGIYGMLVDAQGAVQIHPDAALIDFNTRARHSEAHRTIFDLLASDDERERLRTSFKRLKSGASTLETLHLTVSGRSELVAMTYLGEIGWINLVLADTTKLLGGSDRWIYNILIGGAALLIILVLLPLFARTAIPP
ncbi:MAG: hypothetical protein LBE62_02815 [Azonexus sp.]|nr:hypothetical protein [Azonexus sp.]